MRAYCTRSLFAAFAVLLGLAAAALAASAGANDPANEQTPATVTTTGTWDNTTFTVTARWINSSDPTQTGSQAKPFTPGSKIDLQLTVSGFDPPQNMLLVQNGRLNLGGSAVFMSQALSKNWYTKNSGRNRVAEGFARIDIRPTSVAGGLATWSLASASLQFTNAFGDRVIREIPTLSGSFYIQPSVDPDLQNVQIAATVEEVSEAAYCKSIDASLTREFRLNLTLTNRSGEHLHNLHAEWASGRAVLNDSATRGLTVVSQGAIFGEVKNGASKANDVSAITLCVTGSAASSLGGTFALTEVKVDGYALIGGRQHDRNALQLGSIIAPFEYAPAPAPSLSDEDDSSEVTSPPDDGPPKTSEPLDRPSGDPAAIALAQQKLDKARAQAAASAAAATKKQARAAALTEREARAQADYQSATESLLKADRSHQEAVDKLERLAQAVADGGKAARNKFKKQHQLVNRLQQRVDKRQAEFEAAGNALSKVQAQARRANAESVEAAQIAAADQAAVQAAVAELNALTP